MTLPTHEFIRRFLMTSCPRASNRIRHCGLLASADRVANIEGARQLLAAPSRSKDSETPNAAAADGPRVLRVHVPAAGNG